MMPTSAANRVRLRGRSLRRPLIWAAMTLGAGLVASHAGTCYALAADAYRSVTESYLVMWIERTGAALGCF